MPVPTQELITKWRLDMTGNATQIQEYFRDMRKMELLESKVDKMQGRRSGTLDKYGRKIKQVGDETKKATEKVKGMSRGSRALSTAMGNLASRGLSAVLMSLRDIAGESGQFTQALNIYTGNINDARQATRGLVGDLEIMNSKNKLTTLGVKLTDTQYVRLLKTTQKVATAMGREMGPALDDIATALARQSIRVADNVGVVMTQAQASAKWAAANRRTVKSMTDLEKRLAFQIEFMTQLEKKAAELPKRIDTTADSFRRFTVTLKNATLTMLDAINKSATLRKALVPLNILAKEWGRLWRSDTTAERLRGTRWEIAKIEAALKGLPDPALKYSIGIGRARLSLGQKWSLEQNRVKLQTRLNMLKRDEAGTAAFLALQAEKIARAEHIAMLRRLSGAEGKPPKPPMLPRGRKKEIFAGPIITAIKVELETLGKVAEIYKNKIAESLQFWKGTKRLLTESEVKVIAMAKSLASATKTALSIKAPPIMKGFDDEKLQQLMAFNEQFRVMAEKLRAMAQAGKAGSDEFAKLSAQTLALGAKTQAAATNLTTFRTNINETISDLASTGKQAMGDFAASIITAADASIQGTETMGRAIAIALKQSLLAIAKESIVKALFALAEFLFTRDPSKLAAAGMYAAVAVAAGGAGLGISAAVPDKASSGSTDKASSTSAPQQFGQTVEDKRPVNVNVFFNDPFDPSSARVRQRSISTSINRAQTTT